MSNTTEIYLSFTSHEARDRRSISRMLTVTVMVKNAVMTLNILDNAQYLCQYRQLFNVCSYQSLCQRNICANTVEQRYALLSKAQIFKYYFEQF